MLNEDFVNGATFFWAEIFSGHIMRKEATSRETAGMSIGEKKKPLLG